MDLGPTKKPCPFCGGQSRLVRDASRSHRFTYTIECPSCPATMKGELEKITKAWDTRIRRDR